MSTNTKPGTSHHRSPGGKRRRNGLGSTIQWKRKGYYQSDQHWNFSLPAIPTMKLLHNQPDQHWDYYIARLTNTGTVALSARPTLELLHCKPDQTNTETITLSIKPRLELLPCQSDQQWNCYKGNTGVTERRQMQSAYALSRAHVYHLKLVK